ncbi:MAG: pyridoxal-phosphate dependent enzyme, partial [Bryobacteraceae bacterium]
MGKPTHLECSLCHQQVEAGQVANLCAACGGPLLVRYEMGTLRHRWPRRQVAEGPPSMWRYAPVLPAAPASVISLGEGWTPLIRTRRLGSRLGAEALWVKDEGLNPTASFKARGLSCAISMCVELGIRKVAIPSAGNAASALAAYAAAAGIESHIFMPRDVPQANYLECMAYGANVTLVDGLISDCGRMV